MDTSIITTRLRAIAAEMTAAHTFGPGEVGRVAAELRTLANDIELQTQLAAETAAPESEPGLPEHDPSSPPPLDAVEDGADPNPPTTDDTEPQPEAA